MSANVSEPKCVYCGDLATTRDHIPPQNLFQKPYPPLITVPACKPCNSEASVDDEYFRNVLILDHRLENHPETKRLIEAFKRSLQRPEALGLRTSLVRNLRRVPLISSTGLYYGQGAALKGDFNRISKVLTRIVKGLFFHQFQKPLPGDCSISVHSSQEINQDLEAINSVLKMVKAIETRVTVGNDVFSYSCVVFKDQPNATFWMLGFFNTLPFFVMTRPPQLSLE